MALQKGFLVRLSYHIEPPPHMLVPINQNAKRKTQNAKRKTQRDKYCERSQKRFISVPNVINL